MTCPVCGGGSLSVVMEDVFDDRYGHPGLFSLAGCRDCGHTMTAPSLAEEDLSVLYGTYYPRKSTDIPALAGQVGDPGSRRQRLLRWLRGTDNQGQYLVEPGMRVLDYGCGAAGSLLEIQRLGGEAYGIEADPNVRAIAEHYGLNIHIGRIEDNPFPGVKFDLIILNQVVEHLPDPAKLLRCLVGWLTEGGRIVLSFPNTGSLYCRLYGSKWINWHIPYHLQHFNRGSFARFAQKNGLRILRFRTVTPNLWTILQFRTLCFPTTRGVPNAMWGACKRANFTKRLLLKLGTLSAWAVICLANRMIDALALGDSIVVVLKPGRDT